MASRNPLINRSPIADRPSTATMESPMRATTPNFQFNEGHKNREYVSPTFQSNVFGAPTTASPQSTHRRDYNSQVFTPAKLSMEVRPVEQTPIQVNMTPAKQAEAMTPVKKTPPPSAPVMDNSPQPVTQSPLYGGIQRTHDRNYQSPDVTLRSSPTKSQHKPRDNDLFAGPRYTPQKDGAAGLRSDHHEKKGKEPICMQCANEDSESLKANARKEKLLNEREFDKKQQEMMRQLDEERARRAAEARDMVRDSYNNDLQRSERKRQEVLDSRKTDRDVVEAFRTQQQEIQANYERSRQEYNAEMQKFRHDLEEQRRAQDERRAQQRNTERKMEQQHVGLPVGTYRWDYRDELASELHRQMEDKKRMSEAQRREDIERANKQAEELKRIREWERNYREEEERHKNQQVSQIMSDLKDIQSKRAELRSREEDNKRREREAMNEAARIRRENELRDKYSRMLMMNQSYMDQIAEKKARLNEQREQQIKEMKEVAMRTPPKQHVCSHINCARCNRTIPASGAFLE